MSPLQSVISHGTILASKRTSIVRNPEIKPAQGHQKTTFSKSAPHLDLTANARLIFMPLSASTMFSHLRTRALALTRTLSTYASPRTNWTRKEISTIYTTPLLDLIHRASATHRENFNPREVQKCTLLSIKTGGCPEDCSYCSQSSRYDTSVKAERLMSVDDVLQKAQEAKHSGSTRFCMGAAWRGVSQVSDRQFERVLSMVSGVREMGMEVCATLGMLTADQAQRLRQAGLTAYNHNLDTSESFYPEVITSRTYSDRLETLSNVRDAGISVCCGGILGLGESHDDRISLLHTLATMPHPESVPVNALVPNEGTPLEENEPVSVWDLLRMIATARILMPASMVRLSAGRIALSKPEQALCFMAGANSIFTGDKLLTTANSEFEEDTQLFEDLGLTGQKPFSGPLRESERQSGANVAHAG